MIAYRKNYIPFVLKCIAVCMIILLYTYFDARSPASFFPQCPFHLLTGLYCPGCGAQRALSALLHGNFLESLHDNLLAISSLPLLGYAAIVFVLNTFRKSKLAQPVFYTRWFVWTVFITVMLFTILRNIPHAPFTALAPLP